MTSPEVTPLVKFGSWLSRLPRSLQKRHAAHKSLSRRKTVVSGRSTRQRKQGVLRAERSSRSGGKSATRQDAEDETLSDILLFHRPKPDQSSRRVFKPRTFDASFRRSIVFLDFLLTHTNASFNVFPASGQPQAFPYS